MNSELFALAVRLAHHAHAGQVDKSGQPYIDHCRRVSERAEGTEAKVVAWLHDVLEDTNVTESELRKYFSGEIVDAIVVLTHPNGEPNVTYWNRVKQNELARQVKLADIEDNLDITRLILLDRNTVIRLINKYSEAMAVIEKLEE